MVRPAHRDIGTPFDGPQLALRDLAGAADLDADLAAIRTPLAQLATRTSLSAAGPAAP